MDKRALLTAGLAWSVTLPAVAQETVWDILAGGMSVDKDENALTASHKGQIYCFCSAGCRTTFLANPSAYVS